MLQIDGALGEGGGQVLRSALALALITGTPFRLVNIRARRPKPGLMAQHLNAVRAAAKIAAAQVEGARLGSGVLTFAPGAVRAGSYAFDIGTAGAATLVLQTVLLPLSRADATSRVTITGGTHVPWSPCFEYLDRQWLHWLRVMGVSARVQLQTAGFYPQGGGRLTASIEPIRAGLRPLQLIERGVLHAVHGISAVANLDRSIAERQRQRALQRLAALPAVDVEVVTLPAARSRGTLLFLLAEFEHAQACYFALGARGKPAERVADEAADALLRFVATDGAIDEYLADQLVLPLALANGTSELRLARVTPHLVTNCEVVRRFLPIEIDIAGALGEPGRFRIVSGGAGG